MAKKLVLRKQKSPYTGEFTDVTKSKTLSLAELDNNQIYLKGLNIFTGSTIGTDLILDKLNGDQITIDLSAFSGGTSGGTVDVDYGNIIFVSENGADSGFTRGDVIGNITTPVGLELASQIAQSGDTIHVKSGIYTVNTTDSRGIAVQGVDYFFEDNAKIYKSTSGPLFSMLNVNVYGGGSFYGSGSTDSLFFFDPADNITGQSTIIEWDVCRHDNGDAITGSVYGQSDVKLKGKRSIYSETGSAIFVNTYESTLTTDCPIIETNTSGAGALVLGAAAGVSNNNTINASEIKSPSATRSVFVGDYVTGQTVTINATFIEKVEASGNNYLGLTINGSRINEMTFNGDFFNGNTHIGWFRHDGTGISKVQLVDRCWGAGSFTLETTLNGDFDFTSDSNGSALVTSFAGNNKVRLKLQKKKPTPGPFQYDFVDGWFMSNAGGNMTFLGQWDIQNFWITQSGGKISIPSGTQLNIGPDNPSGTLGFGSIGETFNFTGVDFTVAGTIVERCGTFAPCEFQESQSAQTYSNTFMYVNDWGEAGLPFTSTRIIFNGGTVIVRDQNSQIITTDVSGGTIGIYSAGLNTNKLNSFEAEQEKRRITVSGTAASYTINGETFTSTTGTTAAECAEELVSLTNASGTLDATASQDNNGVDEYFYVESDTAGEALTLVYGTATAADAVIRYNTKLITDTIGGMLIEDADIIKDQYN